MQTRPVDWIGKSCVGYVLNAEFSEESTEKLKTLITELASVFQDAVFCMPAQSLHITLMDWVAPLVAYDNQDKATLFESIYDTYNGVIEEICSSIGPITLGFNKLNVSESTIYVTAQDDGQFEHIRNQFIDKVALLPGTKMPPQIIHSSLARFTKAIDLEAVQSFANTKHIRLTNTVTNFRLTRSSREPMLEFEVLKRYKLGQN